MKELLLKINFEALSTKVMDVLTFWFTDNINYTMGFIILFFLFFRWWGINKLALFLLIILPLFWVMLRLSDFFMVYFGKEDGFSFALLVKPIFIIIMALVFIYFCFLKK